MHGVCVALTPAAWHFTDRSQAYENDEQARNLLIAVPTVARYNA